MKTLTLAVVASLALLSPLRAQDLQRFLNRLSGSWARGQIDAITSLAAGDGISIDIGQGSMGPVGQRRASALLRQAFDTRQTVSVHADYVRPVTGNPNRAYAQLTWLARRRGTTIPMPVTVFLGLVREGRQWRIIEIRLKT